MTDSASGTKALANEPASLTDIDQVQKQLDGMWNEIYMTARAQAESSVREERRLDRAEDEVADAQERIAWLWVAASLFFVYEIVKLVILFV